METETASALLLAPDACEPHYWHARALLHVGRSPEAKAELAALPGPARPAHERLLAIAALAVGRELDQVEACVRAVAGAWGELGPAELRLALVHLEVNLQPAVGDSAERLARVGDFSRMVMEAVGPLPWARYNVAVKKVVVDRDDFQGAALLLSEPVTAPPRGYPTYLLRAACDTILGRFGELFGVLKDSAGMHEEFAGDESCFMAALQVLRHLVANDDLAETVAHVRRMDLASAKLVQEVPELTGICLLLRDLVADEAAGTGQALASRDLVASPWAEWIRLRLWLTRTPIAEIPAALEASLPKTAHAELIWERATWAQDFEAVAGGSHVLQAMEAFPTLRPLLEGAFPFPSSSSVWWRLLELRHSLVLLDGQMPEGHDPMSAYMMGPCPWIPTDSPLQPWAQREALVELCYLEGRHALRRRCGEEALWWFSGAGGHAPCDGDSLGDRLTRGRFGPLLAYWRGVTLAHLGRLQDAKEALGRCLSGPKAVEARVQLGFVAAAEGDLETARRCVSETPEPHVVSTRYLAGLLAERSGSMDEAREGLTRLVQANSGRRSIYVAAAERLLGLLDEREDEASGPARYRSVLSCCPTDPVAASRLGRVWLRDAYHRIRSGQEIQAEPLLDSLWDLIGTGDWAACLPVLHNLLLSADGGLDADGFSFDPGWPPFSSAGRQAFARLAVRVLLGLGQTDRAVEVAEALAAKNPESQHMAAVVAILGGARSLTAACQQGDTGAVRTTAKQLAASLDEVRSQLPSDPAIAFWHDVARALSDPELLEVQELFRTILSDDGRPSTQRALAAALGLFCGNGETRDQAAELCRRLVSAEAFADATTTTVVLCLAAYASGSDQEFLEAYTVQEKDLSAFLCDERALYVAACEARLRTGQVDAITQGIVPDSLAELDDPEVRRLFGLAYAQRAAREADKDARAALKDLEQAAELLGAW